MIFKVKKPQIMIDFWNKVESIIKHINDYITKSKCKQIICLIPSDFKSSLNFPMDEDFELRIPSTFTSSIRMVDGLMNTTIIIILMAIPKKLRVMRMRTLKGFYLPRSLKNMTMTIISIASMALLLMMIMMTTRTMITKKHSNLLPIIRLFFTNILLTLHYEYILLTCHLRQQSKQFLSIIAQKPVMGYST